MKTLFPLSLFIFLLISCAVPAEKGKPLMGNDENAVRQWFERWMKATKEGDLQLARSLIADDAVFLVPGADRMDKESFAAAVTATDPNTVFELDCSIQEIRVLGDHAWLWSKSSLRMTDKRSETSSTMAGHSLSILERRGNSWVVIRDANTVVPVSQN
ncbi:MAG: SgcJ/EcaC family oxidoreductase [Planctomycetes bacterium]|nr:SgcJ/EcaC family oxidoreductase [Planctomycetota bacterium]MBI3845265.1 SgcJ/EcaC family oxidoreductase [Planctomycetota bacterium]